MADDIYFLIYQNSCRILWYKFEARTTTHLLSHYSDVYSTVQRKHLSSASLASVRGIHRWPLNSSHKWPVTRKMFPFDYVIMQKVLHFPDFCLNHFTIIFETHKHPFTSEWNMCQTVDCCYTGNDHCLSNKIQSHRSLLMYNIYSSCPGILKIAHSTAT